MSNKKKTPSGDFPLQTVKYLNRARLTGNVLLIFVATLFVKGELHGNPVVRADPFCGLREVLGCAIDGFQGRVDFLCWQADEDGLEYGTRMEAPPLIGQSSTTRTRVLDLNFDWDPGFRLGIGYLSDCLDCWAINLNWTRIRNRASASTSAQGVESQVGSVDTIISPWVNLLFELRFGASGASARWHLNYDVLDLDFGRECCLSNWFSFNPFIGFRVAWIDQHYQAKYNGVFILAENAPTFTREVVFKAKNDFTGFGLRGGTELICHLTRCWHLFAQVSGSILRGKFRVSMQNLNDQGLGEGSIPPMPLDFTADESLWRVRLNFDEAVGIGWQTFFRCGQYRLRARVAYEMSQWLSQNQLFYTFYFRGQDTISSVPIRSQGNLGFHGIRAGIQFDF